ncbi:outer membrane protein assembly factor [Sinisalibacter aestuarii]|uniref:Outer membrane protein assembly factor n=2 Tax=Sinisalibacter aestuarii TaxID=2949426 RepID=A0ABQ5LX35_9RHOB|nr:outer membrane protein assembly factor [Sinisalibacter aestuarii]
MRANRLTTAMGFLAALALSAAAAPAFDRLDFAVGGDDARVAAALESASLLATQQGDPDTDPRDVLAAARADYGRLLNALYSEGHYGGVIHILVDGQEAAGISPFAAPARIGRVQVNVTPGPKFRFDKAEILPLAPGTSPATDFRSGAIARSTAIQGAVSTAVEDWRDAGRAKAAVTSQSITADHRDATLDAQVGLTPGPIVRFGNLVQLTPSAVRAERIARIAGLRTGLIFSPARLALVAERLRRTGAFSSVSLTEAEVLGPGNRMDIALSVADEKPRRFGFGVELQSLDGLAVSGYWLHRNLLGGAERLRIDAEISGIDGTLPGMDATLAARLDIPAAFGTDTDAFVTLDAEYTDDPAFRLYQGGGSFGVHRRFSARLDGELGLAYHYAIYRDDLGTRRFSLVSAPGTLTWDGRNSQLDPSTGLYLNADLEPFHDISSGITGARAWLDGRAYYGLAEDRFVFAGRVLVGSVIGADATAVPPDYLFFSGGGGTVRGFPYQSLGIDIGGGDTIGGRAFLGASGELRYRVSDTIGLVGFADIGTLGAASFLDGGGGTQIGAGVGLRYYTGLGPIRLDVALPVSGPGADGAQLYLGIGQSF